MIRLAGHQLDGILFDKDGTLLDFHRTWDAAVGATLDDLATDDVSRAGAAAAVGYDIESQRVLPTSPIVAESNATIRVLLDPWVDTSRFEERLIVHGIASTAPEPGAAEVIAELAAHPVRLGLVTNDAESVARAQLEKLGWIRWFGAVIGYDSGHGAKPRPGPVLAAVEQLGLSPARTLMVGDSTHDVEAALEAGVVAAYVGSDPAVADGAHVWIGAITDLTA